jgi:5'-3' exonuclease
VKPRIVLIDLSALFVPAWRANENGPVSIAYESTIGGVNRIATQFPDALLAVCCDGKGNWRKDISPDYKAQRDKLPDVFYEQFRSTKERLRADGRLLWEFEGFEADDVIATACQKAWQAEHRITICTHDKDLYALVRRDSIDVLSLSTWEIRTEDDVIKKFKIVPTQMADFLALTGDASDNVPGCEGIGPVKASQLLEKFKDAEAVCTALAADLVDCVGPALAGKISTSRENIRLSRKLVELRFDVPLKFEEIYEKRDQVALATRQENPMEKAILETGLAARMGANAQYHVGSEKNLDEQQYFGFIGAGVAAFPDASRAVLSEPVNQNDVEIRQDGLVYLSGTFYRRQLTKAFGQGGWALLPRSRPLASDGVVVWHGALVCLGRFVSESFGEKEFNARNGNDSYPNAAEAAKTDCLRRCVKDLGWSWELWSKEWTEQWKKKYAEQYKNNGRDCWRKKPCLSG